MSKTELKSRTPTAATRAASQAVAAPPAHHLLAATSVLPPAVELGTPEVDMLHPPSLSPYRPLRTRIAPSGVGWHHLQGVGFFRNTATVSSTKDSSECALQRRGPLFCPVVSWAWWWLGF